MSGPDFPADFPDADEASTVVEPTKTEPRVRSNGANGHASGHANGKPALTAVPHFDRLIKAKPATEDERMPPNDMEAEASVIQIGMAHPPSFEVMKAALIPGDFFSGAHMTVFDAMLKVQGPVDNVTVAGQLKQDGRLAQIGGMSGLTEMYGSGRGLYGNIKSYIAIVKELSHQRSLLVASQLAVAQLFARTGQDALNIASALRVQIEKFEEARRPLCQFLTTDEILSPEPPADLVIPKLGLGPGPVAGFFGQGYSGKSISACFALGLAVALGKDVWGAFRCKPGTWVHFDYEQGKRRTKTIIQRMLRAEGAGKLDIEGRVKPMIYPSINLTSPGAIDFFSHAFEGATVASVDALKGMTPGVDENDSRMRDFIGVLRIASEKTGAMVVLVHHAGKTKDQEKPRKEAGRGSSAIYDECASVFVMSAKKGDPTTVTHEKDRELGYLVEDFGLVIEDVPTDDGDPRGGLRVRHMCKEELKEALAKKEGSGKAKLDALLKSVRDCIRDNPGVSGVEGLKLILRGNDGMMRLAVRELLATGEVVERKVAQSRGGKPLPRLFLAAMAPPDLHVVVPFEKKDGAPGDDD